MSCPFVYIIMHKQNIFSKRAECRCLLCCTTHIIVLHCLLEHCLEHCLQTSLVSVCDFPFESWKYCISVDNVNCSLTLPVMYQSHRKGGQ